jgi:hypothetical protein
LDHGIPFKQGPLTPSACQRSCYQVTRPRCGARHMPQDTGYGARSRFDTA